MWWLSCVPEYFLHFFNCFFISSWIAMFSYSGDFEVLLLVSFHRFCSFCHCLCYCKVMEMYLYVDLGLFFGRFWSLPYFPIKSFHANLRILSSLNPKINQIKLHSFIQSRNCKNYIRFTFLTLSQCFQTWMSLWDFLLSGYF